MDLGAHKAGEVLGLDRRTRRDSVRIEEMEKLGEMAPADAPGVGLTSPILTAEGVVRL
jgi:hypothetical protein